MSLVGNLYLRPLYFDTYFDTYIFRYVYCDTYMFGTCIFDTLRILTLPWPCSSRGVYFSFPPQLVSKFPSAFRHAGGTTHSGTIIMPCHATTRALALLLATQTDHCTDRMQKRRRNARRDTRNR